MTTLVHMDASAGLCARSSQPCSVSAQSHSAGRSARLTGAHIVAITGDPKALMWWTLSRYCTCIVLRYGVRLVGWPEGMKFSNPSSKDDSAGGEESKCGRVQTLLQLLEDGKLKFVKASAAFMCAARESPYNVCPGGPVRVADVLPRASRSDFGARRPRPKTDKPGTQPRYIRCGPKTPRRVGDEWDD